MKIQSLVLAFMVLASGPATVSAAEHGIIAGLDVSTGIASGSSSTTDGGAPFAGGGAVTHVKLGEVTGIGAHIGYQPDPAVSVFISYQHVRGDIGWEAVFPLIGVASEFEGSAISNAVTGGFETGNTRVGNLGGTDINPYRISDVWRTSLVASIEFRL